MKAAVLYKAKTPLVVEEIDFGNPQDNEVLVEMKASGVCHSDWHIIKGEWTQFNFPIVLGHEGAGIVGAVGPGVTSVKPGDHVLLAWRTNCSLCAMCQQGWPNLCLNAEADSQRATLVDKDTPVNQLLRLGTFATHAMVPEASVVRIDRDIPFPQLSLVGCGVMTGVGAVINTARVHPGSSVVVFGCGGGGLNCIQGAVIAGATTIIGVDLMEAKLQRARSFGATHTIDASSSDPVVRIIELTDGAGADYAFEAIGLAEKPFIQSIRCTRRRGVTIWVGHAPLNTPVTIDARDLMQEKTVMGSMYGSAKPRLDFPRLLDLYRNGKLELDKLISRRFALEEINEAFEVLARGEVARSVVIYD